MSVLSIFKASKTKSFSLEATLASWPDAPKFLGKRKKDTLSIEQWLDAVAAGCKERDVDEKNWPVVARALLGEKALGRLEEFERVLATMQGKDVVWTWERFRVAMGSMGWNISGKKTRAFTVAAKKCGLWWVVGKRENSTAPSVTASSTPSRSSTTDTRPPTTDARPKPKRQQTLLQRVTGASITGNSSSVITDEPEAWDVVEKEKRSENAPQQDGSVARRMPARAMSDSIVAVFKPKDGDKEKENTDGGKDGALVRPDAKRTVSEPVSTTVTHAPDWLLNASSALEYLTSEYPKSMTTLSAILITAGSIPALAASGGAAALGPLVAATHGGQAAVALLSGPTAQAVGAIAMGLGNWLKAQNEGQVTTEKPKAIAAK